MNNTKLLFLLQDVEKEHHEEILDASETIVSAASVLIIAAKSAQEELEEQGIISKEATLITSYDQWSEGFVSAAKIVSDAIHALGEATHMFVEGKTTLHTIIASAHQIIASTTHLLIAVQVKANEDSKKAGPLQKACYNVKKSTEELLSEGQKLITQEKIKQDHFTDDVIDRLGPVGKLIEVLLKILKLEEEISKKSEEHSKLLNEIDSTGSSFSLVTKEINAREIISKMKQEKDNTAKVYKQMHQDRYKNNKKSVLVERESVPEIVNKSS